MPEVSEVIALAELKPYVVRERFGDGRIDDVLDGNHRPSASRTPLAMGDQRVAVAATTSLGFEANIDGQRLDSLIAESIEGGRQTRHRRRSLVGPVAQLFRQPELPATVGLLDQLIGRTRQIRPSAARGEVNPSRKEDEGVLRQACLELGDCFP